MGGIPRIEDLPNIVARHDSDIDRLLRNVATGDNGEHNGTGAQSTAVGTGATAAGNGGTSLGDNAEASGGSAVAVGLGADGIAANSIAIGEYAQVTVAATAGVAIGGAAIVTAVAGIGVGPTATVQADRGIALGQYATVQGTGATDGIAIGGASASGTANITYASAEKAVAIGSGADATHARSVALGPAASTTAADQIMLGTASHAVVIPGTLTVGGSSVGGSLTVQDENGNVGTSVTQIDFQGAGVTATAGTGEVVVTIPGGTAATWEQDYFTVSNAATTTYALSQTPIADSEGIFLNGLRLVQTTDYSISGTTLTMSVTLVVGDVIHAHYQR